MMANAKPLGALQAGPYVKKAINAIAALSEAGKYEEAEAKARELYGLYPARADVNDAQSLTLVDQKNYSAALPFAEAAVRIEPRNPAYLVNLGRLYLDLNVIEDALPVLERAIACKPSPFQAAWTIGEFFHETGKASRSIKYFEKALETADSASAILIKQDYLQSLSSLGRTAEAENLASELAANPKYKAFAITRLASLAKHKTDSEIFLQLMALFESADLAVESKNSVASEIGRIYENSKQYDDAFHFFTQSKTERKWNGSLEKFTREVDGQIRAYPAEVFGKYREYGSESEQPVFVVGMPRSGTTMTEQLIGAHPLAGGVGELRRMRKLLYNFASVERLEALFDVFRRVGPDKWRDVPNLYLRLINYLEPGKQRIIDKMPHNFVIVGFLALCFPKARIVHVFRNPVDNFISAYQNDMSAFHGYSFDQVTYAKYYLEYRRLMDHWKSVLPGRIFDLPYDQFVKDPEPLARKLIDFIGLEWSDECLKFHEKETTVRTFSKHQVRSAVNANSVERWRNYESHLKPMLETLGIT